MWPIKYNINFKFKGLFQTSCLDGQRQRVTVDSSISFWISIKMFAVLTCFQSRMTFSTFYNVTDVRWRHAAKELPLTFYILPFLTYTFLSNNGKSKIVCVWLQEKLYFEIDLLLDQLTAPQDHLSTESILSQIFLTCGKY